MLSCLAQRLAPIDKKESPAWYYQSARLLLAIFFLVLPTIYDSKVPEVGADMKWTISHAVSLFLSGLFFISWAKKKAVIELKLPLAAWAVVVFLLFAALSCIDTYNPYRSWWFFKHAASYGLVFFLVYGLRHAEWYKGLLAVLLIPFAFNSILGICHYFAVTDAQIATVLPFWEYFSPFVDRFRQSAPPAATFANKNIAASYTVMMLPIALYALVAWRGKVAQVLAMVSLSLGMTFLVYTRSRGSWVAAIAAVIFLLIWGVAIKENRQALVESLSKFQVALLALALVVTISNGQFKSNVDAKYHSVGKSVHEQFSSIARMGEGDIGSRFAYWLNSLVAIAEHPFNGTGLNTFQVIYPKYHRAIYDTPRVGYAVEARPQRAHNDFIQAFVETGIIGGLAFAFIYLSTLIMGWKLARSKASTEVKVTSIFLVTASMGISVNALGDFPFQMPVAPVVSWTFVAILTGLYHMEFKEKALVGLKKFKLSLPSFAPTVVGILLFVIFTQILNDDLKRRDASVYLKYVMSYSAAGVFNDRVYDDLEKAYEVYPYYARIREYRGTIPVNYKGNRAIALDTLIKVGEDAIKYDPYAPNNLINIGGTYFRKAMQTERLGDGKTAQEYADKMLEVYERLKPLAYFAAHTYTLGAYAYLVKEEANKSLSLFQKALELDPEYDAALTGKNLAIAALRLEGYDDRAIQIMSGEAPMTPTLMSKQDIVEMLQEKAATQAPVITPKQ